MIALGIISLAVRQLFMLTAFGAANETSNKNTITNGVTPAVTIVMPSPEQFMFTNAQEQAGRKKHTSRL